MGLECGSGSGSGSGRRGRGEGGRDPIMKDLEYNAEEDLLS